MKNTFLGILLLVATLGQINAQVAGNNQYNSEQSPPNSDNNRFNNNMVLDKNEITLNVNGLYNATPDSYAATFNLVQTAETAELTDQLLNQRIILFKQRLHRIGIDTTDVRVDMISFVPKYEIESENKLFSKSFNEIPSGFELQKNITMQYRNSKLLDRVVTAAAQSEIYDLVKVDYFLVNAPQLIDTLRTKCLREMAMRTKSYQILGLKMDTLKKVLSENIVTVYPETRYFGYQAFSRGSQNFSRKKTSITFNEIPKTISKYYKKLEYDKYDIVINPVTLEPSIQISYSLTVKYLIEADKKSKEIYMLTPLGDLKKLAVDN